MTKKKLWLIVIGVGAIAFSANAFAMMSGNNGFNNHTQRYGSGEYHMNDDNRGNYRDNNRNFHNGNNNDSHMDDYNRDYYKDGSEHNMGNEYNFRGNNKQGISPDGDRYKEDHRYRRD
ncbi:MAG: hypothetical protein WBB23_22910 [Desulforhopalus sp.]